jgi:energy-coupling factor transporter transmembrane protein EcfT
MYLLLNILPFEWKEFTDSYEPGPGVLMRLFRTKLLIIIIIMIIMIVIIIMIIMILMIVMIILIKFIITRNKNKINMVIQPL